MGAINLIYALRVLRRREEKMRIFFPLNCFSFHLELNISYNVWVVAIMPWQAREKIVLALCYEFMGCTIKSNKRA